MKPIWYFIGLILLILGSIITLTGIVGFFNPPDYPKILAHLHADIWWGALMLIFGLVFYLRFRNEQVD